MTYCTYSYSIYLLPALHQTQAHQNRIEHELARTTVSSASYVQLGVREAVRDRSAGLPITSERNARNVNLEQPADDRIQLPEHNELDARGVENRD